MNISFFPYQLTIIMFSSNGKASSATETYGIVKFVPGMTASAGKCSIFSRSRLPRDEREATPPSLFPPQETTSTMTNFPLASVTANTMIEKKILIVKKLGPRFFFYPNMFSIYSTKAISKTKSCAEISRNLQPLLLFWHRYHFSLKHCPQYLAGFFYNVSNCNIVDTPARK